VGDLPGLRSRLGYLADLGVDAIWLAPFYPSPLGDGGYDVSDYRAVDPLLGTMADFDGLIQDTAALQIRVIVDLVPNHCLSAHPLFQVALDIVVRRFRVDPRARWQPAARYRRVAFGLIPPVCP